MNMVTVPVRMLAFHDANTVRNVNIPEEPTDPPLDLYGRPSQLLNMTFYFGQNDFACGPDADVTRQTICSVSVGDVVELPTGNFLIVRSGFYLLDDSEYDTYKQLPGKPDRILFAMSQEPNT
jgi:hypothetical protein